MRPRFLTLAALAALLAPTTALDAQSVIPTKYHDVRVERVAEGLVHPWSIAFLPDGDVLVTERPGRLRVIRDGRLLPDAVSGVPEVFAEGQGGLLDVVPHPDFANNRWLYISYSKPLAEGSTTAVVRGRFENDALTGVEEIFEAESQGRGHYGSRIAFDGEGHVFITVGDRQAPPSGDLEAHPAQDLSNHHGTVVRLNEDGSVPADNPFVNRPGARPEIYSYGHRNPQGLAIHPETGAVWANEHGPQGGDEVNLVQPGLNYGWPVIGYGVNYRSGQAIHESTQREGMENPAHVWVPSIAASGMLIYAGDAFPRWRGSMFVGGMAGEQLARLTLEGDRVVEEETVLRGVGRIRDVRQAPDGSIWLAIDHRGGNPTPIVRLVPAN